MQKALLILLITLCFGCKKQGPGQTWLYSEDGVEVFNGRVKEIVEQDSSLPGWYSSDDFNKKGNMTYSLIKAGGALGGDLELPNKILKTYYHVIINVDGTIKTIAANAITISSNKKQKDDTQKYQIRFDKSGHLAQFIYGDSGKGITNYYKCDKYGKVLQCNICFNNQPSRFGYEYKYDHNQLLIQKGLAYDLNKSGSLVEKDSFKYLTFDSCRNWTKMQVYRAGDLPRNNEARTYTVTRKITYY